MFSLSGLGLGPDDFKVLIPPSNQNPPSSVLTTQRAQKASLSGLSIPDLLQRVLQENIQGVNLEQILSRLWVLLFTQFSILDSQPNNLAMQEIEAADQRHNQIKTSFFLQLEFLKNQYLKKQPIKQREFYKAFANWEQKYQRHELIQLFQEIKAISQLPHTVYYILQSIYFSAHVTEALKELPYTKLSQLRGQLLDELAEWQVQAAQFEKANQSIEQAWEWQVRYQLAHYLTGKLENDDYFMIYLGYTALSNYKQLFTESELQKVNSYLVRNSHLNGQNDYQKFLLLMLFVCLTPSFLSETCHANLLQIANIDTKVDEESKYSALVDFLTTVFSNQNAHTEKLPAILAEANQLIAEIAKLQNQRTYLKGFKDLPNVAIKVWFHYAGPRIPFSQFSESALQCYEKSPSYKQVNSFLDMLTNGNAKYEQLYASHREDLASYQDVLTQQNLTLIHNLYNFTDLVLSAAYLQTHHAKNRQLQLEVDKVFAQTRYATEQQLQKLEDSIAELDPEQVELLRATQREFAAQIEIIKSNFAPKKAYYNQFMLSFYLYLGKISALLNSISTLAPSKQSERSKEKHISISFGLKNNSIESMLQLFSILAERLRHKLAQLPELKENNSIIAEEETQFLPQQKINSCRNRLLAPLTTPVIENISVESLVKQLPSQLLQTLYMAKIASSYFTHKETKVNVKLAQHIIKTLENERGELRKLNKKPPNQSILAINNQFIQDLFAKKFQAICEKAKLAGPEQLLILFQADGSLRSHPWLAQAFTHTPYYNNGYLTKMPTTVWQPIKKELLANLLEESNLRFNLKNLANGSDASWHVELRGRIAQFLLDTMGENDAKLQRYVLLQIMLGESSLTFDSQQILINYISEQHPIQDDLSINYFKTYPQALQEVQGLTDRQIFDLCFPGSINKNILHVISNKMYEHYEKQPEEETRDSVLLKGRIIQNCYWVIENIKKMQKLQNYEALLICALDTCQKLQDLTMALGSIRSNKIEFTPQANRRNQFFNNNISPDIAISIIDIAKDKLLEYPPIEQEFTKRNKQELTAQHQA
jgi:hypothetical protein